MTLGDIKLVRDGDMSCGNVKLYLFGANAANLKIADAGNPYYGKDATFVYIDANEIAEIIEEEPSYSYLTPGWYHEDDGDWENPMNGYKLEQGLGYAVKAFDSGYAIEYSGQVAKDSEMPAVSLSIEDFIWTGNAAPVDMTLGDFSLSREEGSLSCGSVKLYMFGGNAANLKINDAESPFNGKDATFVYIDEEEIAEIIEEEPSYSYLTPGWYHEDDGDWEVPMNSFPIKSATGFSVKAFDSDYSFLLPGALK